MKKTQFCLKIYDLWIHCPPTGGYMGGWLDGWGHVKSQTQVNFELIEIIQFCLKIYDFWTHPHL